MRVVFDVSNMRRQRAGIGRLSIVLLRALLSSDRQREYILHGWSRDLDRELIQSFVQPNVRLSISGLPAAVKRLYWNLLRHPSLDKLIGSFDIFHSAEPLLPPVGHHHSIITFHDVTYKKFPEFFDEWTAKKWDLLYRRSLLEADAVLVPSENTKNDILEMLTLPPEKIHIVRPPVNPVFTSDATDGAKAEIRRKYGLSDQFVLFVGTLEPRKNVILLVKAFELFLKATRQPLFLVLVGKPGWKYSDIMTTINNSDAREKIKLLDYISDADLSLLYQAALMFIFPSLYEGHGFPVIEAMASGTPVITSNNSSLREIGKDVAMLVDPKDVESMSEAMKVLNGDDNVRSEMARKGRERASYFSAENAAKVILNLYDFLERN